MVSRSIFIRRDGCDKNPGPVMLDFINLKASMVGAMVSLVTGHNEGR